MLKNSMIIKRYMKNSLLFMKKKGKDGYLLNFLPGGDTVNAVVCQVRNSMQL